MVPLTSGWKRLGVTLCHPSLSNGWNIKLIGVKSDIIDLFWCMHCVSSVRPAINTPSNELKCPDCGELLAIYGNIRMPDPKEDQI
jgi:hypothetical protein